MAYPAFDYITPNEYLNIEIRADKKHEYFDGRMYAMAGAGLNHNYVVSSLISNIGSFLKGKKKIYKLTVTMEQAWELFEKQNRKCALSGLPLNFPKDRNPHGGTASLDRIDSNGNYTLDNVQWVHKDINRLKNSFDQDYFINLCKLVSNYLLV